MIKKLKNINWTLVIFPFVIGMNLFSAASFAADGEWSRGVDRLFIALLFTLVLFYMYLVDRQNDLLDSTMIGWEEALDGWKEANELNTRILAEGEKQYSPTSYEPYGFGKADQN